MVKPGIMNHDFADVKAVMSETGKVHMGTGISNEQDRAIKATEEAICNPLLENNSMSGARGILINITGGKDITLHEVDQAVNRIKEESNENANLIWGLTEDEELNGKFKISVISTGIDSESYIENQIENVNVSELNSEYVQENIVEHSEPNNFIDEKSEVKFNESSVEEKSSLNSGSSFIVNLNNNLEEKNDNSIQELEEKARKFKVSEKNENKSSIFSKIFGGNSKINKNEIEELKDKEENNLDVMKQTEKTLEFDDKYNSPGLNKDEDYLNSNSKNENTNKTDSLNSKEQQGLEFEEDLLQIPAFLRRQAN